MRLGYSVTPAIRDVRVSTAKGLDAGQGLNAELSVTKKYYETASVNLKLKSEGNSGDLFFVKFQHRAKLPLLYGNYGWATVFECYWYGSYSPEFNFSYYIPPKAGDSIRVVGYLKKAGKSDFEDEPLLDKTYSNLIDVDWGSGYVDILAFYPTLPFDPDEIDWINCDTGRSLWWDNLRDYSNSEVIVFYEDADKDGKIRGMVYGSYFWTHQHPGFKSNERFALFALLGSFGKTNPGWRYYIYWGPIRWFYDNRDKVYPDGGLIQMLRSGFYSRD